MLFFTKTCAIMSILTLFFLLLLKTRLSLALSCLRFLPEAARSSAAYLLHEKETVPIKTRYSFVALTCNSQATRVCTAEATE